MLARIKRDTSTKWGGLFAAVATAAAVIAVGCGGGPEEPRSQDRTTRASTTVTTGSLGKAKYLAHVNRYCRRDWVRILQAFADLQAKEGSKTSPEELFVKASESFLIPGIQIQFDVMRRNAAPEGEERKVEHMIGALQLAIESGEKMRISSPAQLAAHFGRFNELAIKYGLDDCLVREGFFGAVQP